MLHEDYFFVPFWLRLRRNLCHPTGRAQISRSRRTTSFGELSQDPYFLYCTLDVFLKKRIAPPRKKELSLLLKVRKWSVVENLLTSKWSFSAFRSCSWSQCWWLHFSVLKKQLKQMAYVSTAQTVSTIWLKQCAEEFLNQEAIYLPILEADHVRMILSSTAWPHLFVRADIRILIPFQPYYADEYLFMAIPLILNCFVASLSLLQMDRMFLEVAYSACPLHAVSGKPTRDESKHPIRKRLEEQKFVPNRRHNR